MTREQTQTSRGGKCHAQWGPWGKGTAAESVGSPGTPADVLGARLSGRLQEDVWTQPPGLQSVEAGCDFPVAVVAYSNKSN